MSEIESTQTIVNRKNIDAVVERMKFMEKYNVQLEAKISLLERKLTSQDQIIQQLLKDVSYMRIKMMGSGATS